MVDAVPDWAKDDASVEPAPAAAPDWAQPEPSPPQPEMPSFGTALARGIGAGAGHAWQTGKLLATGERPTAEAPTGPEAAPLEWSDVYSPAAKLLPKLAYTVGESSPTLAGGIMGGLAGAATPVPGGALVGGAGGAALGAAVQTLAPVFSAELKKSPNDPDGAFNRALESSMISAGGAGASWALFPLKIPGVASAAKNALFQILGVQPGVAVGEQMVRNVSEGKAATEDLGPAYATGAVATAIPALGHAAVRTAFRERASVAQTRSQDPILSRLGEPGEGESRGWIQQFNRLYTATKDDLNPIREARNYMTEGASVPAGTDPYVLARLTRGSYGKAEHFIDHGTFDPVTGQDIGMGLKQILEPVRDDLDGFRKYMMARRAIELDGRGIETGIPVRDAHDTVRSNPQYAKPFQGWVKYQTDLLQYMVKAGVVGKQDAARMMDANKDYTPFYRLMEQPNASVSGPGAGITVRNPIRGMSGSQRQILDPIESTIRNTYLYVSLADRNMALQALEKMAAKSPRGAEVMQKKPPEVHPITVTAAEVERGIPGIGHNMGPPLDDFTIFRPNAFRPSPDEIRVFNNGKATTYKVDPYLGAAVNGLDREGIGMLTKIFAAPARLLRAGTTLSPEFMVRNLMRDQMSAFVFSTLGRGYVPFYDFALGMGSVLKQGEGYKNWLKGGGANSAMVSIDRNYVENLVRNMKDPTFMGTMKNVVRAPVDGLRAISELIENATRVGEHMRMTKRGATLPEASFASREVTLDFQRIGSKMRAANAIVAFMNPQLEGVDRAFRAMGTNPLRFTATVGAAITVPSIYLWAANRDDPRVKEIPRWEKDIFWIIATDNWQPVSPQEAQRAPPGYTRKRQDGQWELNKGNIYRFPKPFELGLMFGSVPERILDAWFDKNPRAFKNVFQSIQHAFIPNYVPQAASPIIEQLSNSSLFTGRPLVPRYLEDVMPKEQANPYTTDTAKMIGNFISKIPGMDRHSLSSPLVVENYVRAWTGGLGRHVLDLSDSVLQGSGITPTKISPTLTNADRAIIKAFAVRFPEAGANSIQDFYEEFNKRSEIKKTAAYLRKTGEPQKARDLVENNVLATADGIKKALGAQLKLVRDTYRNPRMSPDEKRKFIDMSYLQMIKMAQTGNEVFKRTEEQFKKRKGHWEE